MSPEDRVAEAIRLAAERQLTPEEAAPWLEPASEAEREEMVGTDFLEVLGQRVKAGREHGWYCQEERELCGGRRGEWGGSAAQQGYGFPLLMRHSGPGFQDAQAELR